MQASSASQKRNKFKGAHVFSQAAGHPASQVNGRIKQSRGRPCSHAAATVCAGKGGSRAGGSPGLRLSRCVSILGEGRAAKHELRYIFTFLFGVRNFRITVTFSRFRCSRTVGMVVMTTDIPATVLATERIRVGTAPHDARYTVHRQTMDHQPKNPMGKRSLSVTPARYYSHGAWWRPECLAHVRRARAATRTSRGARRQTS